MKADNLVFLITFRTGKETREFQFVIWMAHFTRDFFERVELPVASIDVVLVDLKMKHRYN